MRPCLLPLVIVALCAPGCASATEATREVAAQQSMSHRTDPDDAPPIGPSLSAAVARRARSALARAGVADVRITPGYEDQPNAAIEGTWRDHPVQAYVVPTALIPSGDDDLPATESRGPIGGHAVEVVRGEDSSLELLKFDLGSDSNAVNAPIVVPLGPTVALLG